jgi:hypothetical protein
MVAIRVILWCLLVGWMSLTVWIGVSFLGMVNEAESDPAKDPYFALNPGKVLFRPGLLTQRGRELRRRLLRLLLMWPLLLITMVVLSRCSGVNLQGPVK